MNRPIRCARVAAWACLFSLVACFGGEFLQGRPCGSDVDCGPEFVCQDGYCGGLLCGNGVIDEGEECDDGNQDDTDACVAGCLAARCGDGFTGPDEACDDGNADNTDSCTTSCQVAACGDGFLGPGEACDDGNLADDDGCTSACGFPECGDGIVHLVDEQCDDGNDDNSDACLDSCVSAVCGDGYLWADNEECDDGNTFDADACLDTCALASCGDGVLWEGEEQCDDGNDDDTDECTTACLVPSCDDGVQNGGELAVDCGGGCLCSHGSPCESALDCVSGVCTDQACVGRFMVDTGAGFTCAVTDAGDLRCWGKGDLGQLGNGSTANIADDPDELPGDQPVVNVGGTVLQLAAGGNHVCVLLAGGLRCWGNNNKGQLGYGHTEHLGDEPGEVPGTELFVDVGGTIIQVAAAENHSCVVLDTNEVRCWGTGTYGRLGYASEEHIGDDELPVEANAGAPVMVGEDVVQITAGTFHTCALMVSGNVRCWGFGGDGQLGNGEIVPVGWTNHPNVNDQMADLGGELATQVSAGERHTCALMVSGSVRCWGDSDYGQLGYGTTANMLIPGGDVDVGGTVVQLAAGANHTCVVLEGKDVRCWGLGANGRLGYADVESIGDEANEVPADFGPVELGGAVVTQLAARSHTCALQADGTLYCWGQGNQGKLGYGGTEDIGDDETPLSVGPVYYLGR